MGNFAGNLNLGNRFRPPWKVLRLYAALKTPPFKFFFSFFFFFFGGGTDLERGRGMYGPEDPLFAHLPYFHKGPISSKRTRKQGRSQPHSPGWARVPLSSFFPKILIFFPYFSSNFSHFFPRFFSSFWLSGWATRPPGKALATSLLARPLYGKILASTASIFPQILALKPPNNKNVSFFFFFFFCGCVSHGFPELTGLGSGLKMRGLGNKGLETELRLESEFVPKTPGQVHQFHSKKSVSETLQATVENSVMI